eukprot:Skav227130  [mRNA]  locus=scaffold133:190527:192501:- [translate_table: standard]
MAAKGKMVHIQAGHRSILALAMTVAARKVRCMRAATSSCSLLFLDPCRPKLTEQLGEMPLQMAFRGTEETVPEALNRVRPDVVIVRSSKLQEKEIAEAAAGCENLRVVMRAGAGVDNLAIPVLRDRGVQVANAQDANAAAVAELTFAHLLNLDRRLSDQVESLRRGEWRRLDFAVGCQGLLGRRLAVLGVGHIGRQVIQRARAFGMREAERLDVEFCATPEEAVDDADALCVHLALAANTRNLVDRALVVNMSRGGVVDESDLLDAVKDRGIRAGLDVYAKEPSASGTEFEDAAIMKSSSVYGTHHTGARTEQAAIAVEEAVLQVVSAYLEGRPIPGLV